MPKITKTAIEKAAPGFLWDSELKGFGVRIRDSGRATYVIRYRNRARKSRYYTIARTTDLTPQQARERARRLFGEIAGGADPAGEKERLSAEPTLDELWGHYWKRHAIPYTKPGTQNRNRLLWEKHIRPALGARLITDIRRADIAALHAKMSHIPINANRAVVLISKMYNLAAEWEWEWAKDNYNPARRIKKYPERTRDRILSMDEIRRLIVAADAYKPYPYMGLFVRLLLLTGCRNSEIRTAKFSYIDWERRLLQLPDAKAGPRDVVLPLAALALIEANRGREWLFPGRKDHIRDSIWVHFRAIAKAAGLPGVTAHTLRHTVGSIGHRAGLSQREIAGMLGHKQLVTTQRYLHGYAGDGANAAEKVADAIGL